VLDDPELSDDVRLEYSESFYGRCSDYPIEMANHDEARSFLEKVAKDPLGDKIKENSMRSVQRVIVGVLRDEKCSHWVHDKMYPLLIGHLENRQAPEGLKIWSVRCLGDVAIHSQDAEKRDYTVRKILDLF
jgi:hypothetical protein